MQDNARPTRLTGLRQLWAPPDGRSWIHGTVVGGLVLGAQTLAQGPLELSTLGHALALAVAVLTASRPLRNLPDAWYLGADRSLLGLVAMAAAAAAGTLTQAAIFVPASALVVLSGPVITRAWNRYKVWGVFAAAGFFSALMGSWFLLNEEFGARGLAFGLFAAGLLAGSVWLARRRTPSPAPVPAEPAQAPQVPPSVSSPPPETVAAASPAPQPAAAGARWSRPLTWAQAALRSLPRFRFGRRSSGSAA